jgi:glycosyltransferase involved in cell wall biosynthesis
MNRGGVETWLMNVMRNIDRSQFELQFIVNSDVEAAYDGEILSLGGRIHYGGNHLNPLGYATRFKKVVRDFGPFDVLHSHMYWYSGFTVRLGYELGIPIRIAHSHTAVKRRRWQLARSGYENLMRAWILRYSTHRIAVSQQAGEALFGRGRDNHFMLLYYGLDFTPFLDRNHQNVKHEFGIPAERKVVGQIGRFVPLKNHAFTLRVFEHVLADGTDAHLLFVGGGPLLAELREQVASRGLRDRCTFAGLQTNIAPLLFAMDVMVLPSEWEGFPLVALEAQAAGVPVVASTGVPNEASVISELVQYLSLTAGTNAWARAVNVALQQPKRLPPGSEALLLERSRFGVRACLDALSQVYTGSRCPTLCIAA